MTICIQYTSHIISVGSVEFEHFTSEATSKWIASSQFKNFLLLTNTFFCSGMPYLFVAALWHSASILVVTSLTFSESIFCDLGSFHAIFEPGLWAFEIVDDRFHDRFLILILRPGVFGEIPKRKKTNKKHLSRGKLLALLQPNEATLKKHLDQLCISYTGTVP